ncbi:hypothetical protein EG68_12383, partial [Paragonimus skrjabini miyazakii]
GTEAVTFYRQTAGKFGDFPIATGYDPLPVLCEYGGPLATMTMSIKFRSNFPVFLANFVQQNPLFYGCFSETLLNVTPIQCAFACARDFACRSVYFNQQGGECVRMLYADSLLPNSQTSGKTGWMRFAKTCTPTSASNP